MQENLINKIQNLETLTLLSNLNLSDNCIKVVENLDKNTRLSTL
jgi:hypothetical protein